MNVQTIPTFAARGGHNDEPAPPIRAPRGRPEEQLSPADRLRQANDTFKAAIAAAGQAEAEGVSNRDKARKAEDEARHAERDLERQEKEWAEQAQRQVQRLEDQLRKLTSAKVGPPTVAPADRAWARSFLHGLGAGDDGGLTVVATLRRADDHLAGLLAVHAAAGHGLGTAGQHGAGHEVLERLDALECRCWRQIVGRCQLIAGEVEDPA